MKKIRNISIIGAGAMGAAYAAMFTDAVGFFGFLRGTRQAI